MNRSGWIALLVLTADVIAVAGGPSQADPATGDVGSPTTQASLKATLCELGIAPERFHGKVVEVRAIVQTGFETSLLRDDGCSTFIWLSGIDSSQTPLNSPAADNSRLMTLRKDRQYQKMLEYLDKKYKPKDGSVCARCPLNKVTATVVGRFEHVHKGAVDGKTDPPVGFGYLNSYESQLILQGVSDVVAQPIDRSPSKKHK